MAFLTASNGRKLARNDDQRNCERAARRVPCSNWDNRARSDERRPKDMALSQQRLILQVNSDAAGGDRSSICRVFWQLPRLRSSDKSCYSGQAEVTKSKKVRRILSGFHSLADQLIVTVTSV